MPILDIKTYRNQYRTDEFTVPEWFRKLAGPMGHVQGLGSLLS